MKQKTKAKQKVTKRRGESRDAKKVSNQPAAVIPGGIILGEGDIVAFNGRKTVELIVANTGDRPIQVGSHCHFFEANRALRFDREKAYGFRLQVPAGTAVRFEPGEDKRVTLVSIGGNRVAYGINGLVNGRLDDPNVKAKALDCCARTGVHPEKISWTESKEKGERLFKTVSSKAAAGESPGDVPGRHPPTPSCQDSSFPEGDVTSRGENAAGMPFSTADES